MGSPGRHALLTDLVQEKILQAVRAGATREGAARHARIGRSTLQVWLRRGEDGEEPYASFLARVREAEGGIEVRMVVCLLDIAEHCEHPPTRLAAITKVLDRRCGWAQERKAATEAERAAAEQRDAIADAEVVRSVLAALESRKVA